MEIKINHVISLSPETASILGALLTGAASTAEKTESAEPKATSKRGGSKKTETAPAEETKSAPAEEPKITRDTLVALSADKMSAGVTGKQIKQALIANFDLDTGKITELSEDQFEDAQKVISELQPA